MREYRRDCDAPYQQAERESELKNVERAGLGNPLRDEMARKPVPHAYFASDVKEQEQPEHENDWAAQDGSDLRQQELLQHDQR